MAEHELAEGLVQRVAGSGDPPTTGWMRNEVRTADIYTACPNRGSARHLRLFLCLDLLQELFEIITRPQCAQRRRLRQFLAVFSLLEDSVFLAFAQ